MDILLHIGHSGLQLLNVLLCDGDNLLQSAAQVPLHLFAGLLHEVLYFLLSIFRAGAQGALGFFINRLSFSFYFMRHVRR